MLLWQNFRITIETKKIFPPNSKENSVQRYKQQQHYTIFNDLPVYCNQNFFSQPVIQKPFFLREEHSHARPPQNRNEWSRTLEMMIIHKDTFK